MTDTEKIHTLIINSLYQKKIPDFQLFKTLLLKSNINSILYYQNQKITPFSFFIDYYSSLPYSLTKKESLFLFQQVDFYIDYEQKNEFTQIIKSIDNMFLLLTKSNNSYFPIYHPTIFLLLKEHLSSSQQHEKCSQLLTSITSKRFSLSHEQLYEIISFFDVNKPIENLGSMIQYVIENNDSYLLSFSQIFELLKKSDKKQKSDFYLLTSIFFAIIENKFSPSSQELEQIIHLFPQKIRNQSFEEFSYYMHVLPQSNQHDYLNFVSRLIQNYSSCFQLEKMIPLFQKKQYHGVLCLLEKYQFKNDLIKNLTLSSFPNSKPQKI